MAYRSFRERKPIGKDAFAEFRVHEIPCSEFFPEGIKYSLSYIKGGNCILRYDNERAKGHHRHFRHIESKTEFTGIQTLMKKFLDEVRQFRVG